MPSSPGANWSWDSDVFTAGGECRRGRASTGMERHLQRLPRGMPTAQEPAHVYRAKEDTP
jgi:hypothetical protein